MAKDVSTFNPKQQRIAAAYQNWAAVKKQAEDASRQLAALEIAEDYRKSIIKRFATTSVGFLSAFLPLTDAYISEALKGPTETERTRTSSRGSRGGGGRLSDSASDGEGDEFAITKDDDKELVTLIFDEQGKRFSLTIGLDRLSTLIDHFGDDTDALGETIRSEIEPLEDAETPPELTSEHTDRLNFIAENDSSDVLSSYRVMEVSKDKLSREFFDVTTNKEVGVAIRTLRQQRRMTQAVLGETTGIGRTNIIAIEKGRAGVSFQQLSKIADALGMTPQLSWRPTSKPR